MVFIGLGGMGSAHANILSMDEDLFYQKSQGRIDQSTAAKDPQEMQTMDGEGMF